MQPPPGGLPHGGLRGQPQGRPPALLPAGRPAARHRRPRLQLLERGVPPGRAAGGAGRAAEPGQAHRGGPRAAGEAQLRPAGPGGFAPQAAGAEGGGLQPAEQPAAGQGRAGEALRGQQGERRAPGVTYCGRGENGWDCRGKETRGVSERRVPAGGPAGERLRVRGEGRLRVAKGSAALVWESVPPNVVCTENSVVYKGVSEVDGTGGRAVRSKAQRWAGGGGSSGKRQKMSCGFVADVRCLSLSWHTNSGGRQV